MKRMKAKVLIVIASFFISAGIALGIWNTVRLYSKPASKELTEYLGKSFDSAESVLGTPVEGFTISEIKSKRYNWGALRSTYSKNIDNSNVDAEVITSVNLDDKEGGDYTIYGINSQMTRSEAEKELLNHGFEHLPTGLYYNGESILVKVSTVAETLSITAYEIATMQDSEKTEVFMYMGYTMGDVTSSKIVMDSNQEWNLEWTNDDSNYLDEDNNNVWLKSEGVVFAGRRQKGNDKEKTIITNIYIIGEDSPYCLYGLGVDKLKVLKVEARHLGFGSHTAFIFMDPKYYRFNINDSYDGEKAISLRQGESY